MEIKKLFFVLLFLSSLTSAMEMPGSKNDRRSRERETFKEVWVARERSRMEEEGQRVGNLQRGGRVEVVELTMSPLISEDVPPDSAAPDEDEFQQKKKEVREVLKSYACYRSLCYGEKAMEFLNKASWHATVNHDDIEMVKIDHQIATACKSIACDYMDAANAEEYENKNPRPYLKAIDMQVRMIEALGKLKKQMEDKTLTPTSEKQQQDEIQTLRNVAMNLRLNNSFWVKDPNYARLRFFPEMPH